MCCTWCTQKLLSLSNQGPAIRDSPLKSDFTIPARTHKYLLGFPASTTPALSVSPKSSFNLKVSINPRIQLFCFEVVSWV